MSPHSIPFFATGNRPYNNTALLYCLHPPIMTVYMYSWFAFMTKNIHFQFDHTMCILTLCPMLDSIRDIQPAKRNSHKFYNLGQSYFTYTILTGNLLQYNNHRSFVLKRLLSVIYMVTISPPPMCSKYYMSLEKENI